MTPDPLERRLRSVGALLDDAADRFEEGSSSGSCRSPYQAPVRPVRRTRSPLIAAGLLVMVALAGATQLSRGGREPAALAPSSSTVGVLLDDPGLLLIDTYETAEKDLAPSLTPMGSMWIAQSEGFQATVAMAVVGPGEESSLLRFPAEPSATAMVGTSEVSTVRANETTAGLTISKWPRGRDTIIVATRGLDDEEHDAAVGDLVHGQGVDLGEGDALRRFASTYEGPDTNPYYGVRNRAGAAYQTSSGEGVYVTLSSPAVVASRADLRTYAWYLDEAEVVAVDDAEAVLSKGMDRAELWSTTPAGLVLITGPGEQLETRLRQVRYADETAWTQARTRASRPGTKFQTTGTEPPPGD